ncbi:hypothetical protein LA333_00880 [Bacteroides fragilis]|uniref:hypothetical protein n=1 Tax=Bacteroides fragilis TaxID=817 RepID=UPI001CE0BF88|nr:hypothetical protein [Bacteroides fragilis]MCA5604445.1 hypothetical protein [Bacteroides fragilis]
MRAAKCRPQGGVQRGLPLALLGNFQRYVVLRLGKFPNKLRYFLRKYPAACRPSARLPFGGGCPCRLLPRNPHLIFSLPVGGGAVVSVFKGSFAWGGRVQGFPDKYARSEARGRFIGKRRSRLTF